MRPFNVSRAILKEMPEHMLERFANAYGAAAAEFDALRAEAQQKLHDYTRRIDPDPTFMWLLRARVEHNTNERDRCQEAYAQLLARIALLEMAAELEVKS